RVSSASVQINENIKGRINSGFLILLGVEEEDAEDDAVWLAQKIINMRIFSDDQGLMNRSLIDINGEILLISQFTLHASTKKGNRPSFIKAAKPEKAKALYNFMIELLNEQSGKDIQTGEFGADMKVSLVNDGPVTIIIDTKDR